VSSSKKALAEIAVVAHWSFSSPWKLAHQIVVPAITAVQEGALGIVILEA
jgi:hypothetical protein